MYLKSAKRPALFPALVLLAISIPPTMEASTSVTQVHVHGSVVNLFFSNTVGGVEDDVFVFASQGQGSDPNQLLLNITRFDPSMGLFFNGCANIPLSNSQIQINHVGNMPSTGMLTCRICHCWTA